MHSAKGGGYVSLHNTQCGSNVFRGSLNVAQEDPVERAILQEEINHEWPTRSQP